MTTIKKEIGISKRHLLYFGISYIASIIIIFGISHFGKIQDQNPFSQFLTYYSPLTDDSRYFEKYVIGREKHVNTYNGYSYESFRDVYDDEIKYFDQVKHFYLPMIFKEHLWYLILFTVIIYLLLLFRDNYKLKLK